MIETDKLVQEMLSVMGYASQTLRLHPEKVATVEKYLASERVRLASVVKEHQDPDNLDILTRVVVY